MSLIKSYLYNQMNYSQLGSQVQKQYDWEDEKTRYMEMRLETLTQREQLMIDIDCIVESELDGIVSQRLSDELVRRLCDAVCENFPTK